MYLRKTLPLTMYDLNNHIKNSNQNFIDMSKITKKCNETQQNNNYDISSYMIQLLSLLA